MKTSKSLLILGHPRSGKTTLADMIADQYGFSFMSIDALVRTFKEMLPELGMHHEAYNGESALAPFLFKYMDWTAYKPEFWSRRFVFEGCSISPKTADKMINKDKYKIVALACSSVKPEQLALAIRKNDRSYDWTAKKSDEELRKRVTDYIKKAKQIESECKELSIKFIDTSFDRESKLKEFSEHLEDFLNQ